MRLLYVQTRQLHEFFGGDIPPYAILSHTWGKDEVTFQDMQGPRAGYTSKTGWKKIDGFCREIKQVSYVWVDTCCIDKSAVPNSPKPSTPCSPGIEIRRWFKRGWTLQELLAPPEVSFFDAAWYEIGGFRHGDYLESLHFLQIIHDITGIESSYFIRISDESTDILHRASVAERMSWAANRETTRVEDMAYCLLGIFNVNMPMLYGEEDKAFTRLQAEIIKSSGDQSLFSSLFRFPVPGTAISIRLNNASPFLATSPKAFENCSRIRQFPLGPSDELSPFELTHLGLKIGLHILLDQQHTNTAVAILRCWLGDMPIGVPLAKTGIGRNGYYRPAFGRPMLLPVLVRSRASFEEVYIQDPANLQVEPVYTEFRENMVTVAADIPSDRKIRFAEIYPPQRVLQLGESLADVRTLQLRPLAFDQEVFLRFSSATDQHFVCRLPRLDSQDKASWNQYLQNSCVLALSPRDPVSLSRGNPRFSLLSHFTERTYSDAVAQLEWRQTVEFDGMRAYNIVSQGRPGNMHLCLRLDGHPRNGPN